MITAEELQGVVFKTRAGRVHRMEDDRPLLVRLREWCKFTPDTICMRTVMAEFGLNRYQSTAAIQKLAREGFLIRGQKLTSGKSGRKMRAFRYAQGR